MCSPGRGRRYSDLTLTFKLQPRHLPLGMESVLPGLMQWRKQLPITPAPRFYQLSQVSQTPGGPQVPAIQTCFNDRAILRRRTTCCAAMRIQKPVSSSKPCINYCSQPHRLRRKQKGLAQHSPQPLPLPPQCSRWCLHLIILHLHLHLHLLLIQHARYTCWPVRFL